MSWAAAAELGLRVRPLESWPEAFDAERGRRPSPFSAAWSDTCWTLGHELRVPQASDGMPNKIKARGCCAPVWEVDRHGDRIEAGS